uniref:EGF-like domain-containing protein n=1 Tax=Anopheles maculatus TaxID=74869 RepID=A0A182SCA2_9DIPT
MVTQCPDNPCGVQASCRLNTAGVPVCSCPFGYLGDPFKECIRPECVSDGDCTEFQGCRKGNCVDPCIYSCGENAACSTKHHVPLYRIVVRFRLLLFLRLLLVPQYLFGDREEHFLHVDVIFGGCFEQFDLHLVGETFRIFRGNYLARWIVIFVAN